MVDTAVDLFKRRRLAGKTSVLVFYRGERSFFCRQWLRRWMTIPAIERRLELADVALIFTSSQSQGKAFSVAEQIAGPHPLLDSRIFFFGDPEHLLVNYLIESSLSKPVITNPDSHRAHGWVFDYGMVQPAIVAVASESAVVYEWTTKPTILNVAGKLDRPDPWDVWDRIERRLDRIRITKARAARRIHLPSTDSPLPQLPFTPSLSVSTSAADHHSRNSHDLSQSPTQSIPVTKRVQSVPVKSSLLHPMHIPTFADDPCLPPSHRLPNPSNSESDTDIANGPLSTSIDTLVDPTRDATLLQEDLDISQNNLISNIRIHDLSARINALAQDLIAEETMNANAEPRTASDLPAPFRPRVHDELDSLTPRDYSVPASRTEFIRKSFSTNDVDGQPSLCCGSNDFEDIHGNASLSTDDDDVYGDVVDDVDELDDTDRDNDLDMSPQPNVGVDYITNITAKASLAKSKAEKGSLEPLYTSDVQADDLKQFRRYDLYERQSSLAEPLDASVASCGSDQVDSTTVTTKHASMRTDDSSHMPFDSTSFSSDRRIPEEADDRLTGIVNCLKELRDPLMVANEDQHRQTNRLATHNISSDPKIEDSMDEGPTVLPGNSTKKTVSKSVPRGISMTEKRDFPGLLERSDVTERRKRMSAQTFMEKELPLTRSMLAGTTSPCKDRHNYAKQMTLDTSPFLDADNDMEAPEEAMTKSSFRDEYEAYDEYIVCEYEVEEHVEEYDSDTMSRSRGFIRAHTGSRTPIRTASAKNAFKEYASIQSGTRAEQEVSAHAEPAFGRTDGNTLAAMASAPSLTPAVDARVLEWSRERVHSPERSHVRRVLRKIKVPIMAVRRRVGARTRDDGTGTDADTHGRTATTSEVDTEAGRVRRKETLRTVLRKRPAHMKSSHSPKQEESYNGRSEHDTDDQSARVGRKETLRSVLKKLPVSKNRRRVSTGEGTSAQKSFQVGSSGREEVRSQKQRETSGLLSKSSSGHTKTGTLQAVLQRLPSLSGSSRDHRASMPPEVFSVIPEDNQQMRIVRRMSLGVDERRSSRGMKPMSADDTLLSKGNRSTHTVNAPPRGEGADDRSTPSLAQNSTSETLGPESPKLREDSALQRPVYDGDVWVAGLHGAANTSASIANSRNMDGTAIPMSTRPSKFRRSLNRSMHAETSFTEDGIGEDEATRLRENADPDNDALVRMDTRTASSVPGDANGIISPNNGAIETFDRRRRHHRKRRDDHAGSVETEGEKLGTKISFASVSERIFSRFKGTT